MKGLFELWAEQPQQSYENTICCSVSRKIDINFISLFYTLYQIGTELQFLFYLELYEIM